MKTKIQFLLYRMEFIPLPAHPNWVEKKLNLSKTLTIFPSRWKLNNSFSLILGKERQNSWKSLHFAVTKVFIIFPHFQCEFTMTLGSIFYSSEIQIELNGRGRQKTCKVYGTAKFGEHFLKFSHKFRERIRLRSISYY